MKRAYPQGYWSQVFSHAALLLNTKSASSSELAYWMARKIVDQHLLADAEPDAYERPESGLLPLEELALAS